MHFSLASLAAVSVAMSVVSAFTIPEIPLLKQNPLGGGVHDVESLKDAITMSPATVAALKDIASAAGERIDPSFTVFSALFCAFCVPSYSINYDVFSVVSVDSA